MSKKTEAIVDRLVDRALRKVNSMSRKEIEEFEKSIPDPLRKLFEDAYIPMETKA